MSDYNSSPKLQCKSCTEDIFLHSRLAIRCVECDDLDLCPECFGARVELGSHRPDHAYKFIDNRSFSLFSTEWTACEHLRLLEAVEQYGYGNWEDIVRHLNSAGTSETGPSTNWSKKNAPQAKEEFCEVFLNSTIGKHTWHDEQRGRAHDHTIDNFLTPQTQNNDTPPNLTINEAINLGYYPKRDDFETEFDNEAETLIAQLEEYQNLQVFAPGESTKEDEELDMSLKMAHLDMYKTKLRERERRKRVARDHQLISGFFRENPLSADRKNQPKPKKAIKDPILEKLKIWAELLGVKEHQNFLAMTAKERDLKNRIKDLNRFRKNGIGQLSDANEYEVQRMRRSQKRKNEKKKMIIFQSSQPGSIEIDFSALSPPNSNLSEDLSNGSFSSAFQMSPMSNQQNVPATNQPEKLPLERLPGYDILSSNEKKLCYNLKLTPAHYISYKTCLLANHLQKKKGQTPKPLNPSGLDKNNRKIIFNFLMRAGWITAY